jgi:hypothetical protein
MQFGHEFAYKLDDLLGGGVPGLKLFGMTIAKPWRTHYCRIGYTKG